MRHLDEGMIVTVRDGALVDSDALAHIETCASCAQALEMARERQALVTRALDELDSPVELDRARARTRSRLGDGPAPPLRAHRRVVALLGRAAALLLLAAGITYALPHSPLRDWLGPDAPPAESAPPGSEGLEVDVPLTGLTLEVTPPPEGATVDVVWIDAPHVEVTAPAGTRYAVSGDRVAVSLEPGPVRIGLPRRAGPISIESGGRTVLRARDGDVAVMDAAVSRTNQQIILRLGIR